MTSYDFLRRYIEAGTAFTQITKKRAEEVVNELVRSGEIQRGQAQDWVEDLLQRSRKNVEALSVTVRREVAGQLKALGIETVDDLVEMVRDVVNSTVDQAREAGSSALGKRPARARTRGTSAGSAGSSPSPRAASSPSRGAPAAAKATSKRATSPARKAPAPAKRVATGKVGSKAVSTGGPAKAASAAGAAASAARAKPAAASKAKSAVGKSAASKSRQPAKRPGGVRKAGG